MMRAGPLKVVVVGTGFIAAKRHLPAWARMRPLARVAALCDVNLERAQELANRFGVARVHTDVAKMLRDEEPDVVDICTPPATHAEIGVQALQAGSHVLVEKPMALSTDECDELITQGEANGRKVCVAHSDLFYRSFLKAREIVSNGGVGEFRGMRIFLSTPRSYMTADPEHWANRLQGGVLGETGPHAIYLTLAFIDSIRDVHVHGQKVLAEYPWSPFEDYRIDLIGEQGVSSATLVYTTNHWAAQVDIWGSEGMIKVDLESRTLVRYRRRELRPAIVGLSVVSEAAQAIRGAVGTGTRILRGRRESTHSVLIREFCRSIFDGGAPPVTPQEGREAVRVMGLLVDRLQKAGA